jgi:hypothetical protein
VSDNAVRKIALLSWDPVSNKLRVGCLIVVISALIKLAITSSSLKVHQTWGSMVTNSQVQNNYGYQLNEKEWTYTFFSHNLSVPQYYASVIFPPQSNM